MYIISISADLLLSKEQASTISTLEHAQSMHEESEYFLDC